MNGTILDIQGVNVSHGFIRGEQTPDQVDVITFTDKHGNKSEVYIYNGKIIGTTWKKL